jgi:hypothetical protein
MLNNPAVRKCPECGNVMCDMGIYFEPPSVASKRAWAIMELLSRNGYRFPTEGSKAFIYTFILITNRPTLEGVRRRVDVLRWQQEENRMKTRLKGYKEERKRWQCLARKWTQMRTWIGIVLTRFIYSLITSICLCTIGFFYRCRLYPLRFRRFITQLYNLITAILAVLGIGVVAIKTDYWNDIHKFLSDRLTAAISSLAHHSAGFAGNWRMASNYCGPHYCLLHNS